MERASSSDEDKQEIGLQFDAELDNMQIETRPNIDETLMREDLEEKLEVKHSNTPTGSHQKLSTEASLEKIRKAHESSRAEIEELKKEFLELKTSHGQLEGSVQELTTSNVELKTSNTELAGGLLALERWAGRVKCHALLDRVRDFLASISQPGATFYSLTLDYGMTGTIKHLLSNIPQQASLPGWTGSVEDLVHFLTSSRVGSRSASNGAAYDFTPDETIGAVEANQTPERPRLLQLVTLLNEFDGGWDDRSWV